nr:hypothetical protein MarFTME_445 [Marseillevirus futianmevirus]
MQSKLFEKLKPILEKEFFLEPSQLRTKEKTACVKSSLTKELCVSLYFRGSLLSFWSENTDRESRKTSYILHPYSRHYESDDSDDEEETSPEDVFLSELQILEKIKKDILRDNLTRFYHEMNKKNLECIRKLEERILELEFAPGGEKFLGAKEHFEKLIDE